MTLPRTALLGIGAMGSRAAVRLLDAGFDLSVWNRTGGAADELADRGARTCAEPAAAVAKADVILVCVRDDEASAEVWHAIDASGPAAAARIDLSTISPAHARALRARLGARFLEAPMIGSRPQIEAGQLVLLVGGDIETLDVARPVLEAVAGAIHHVGDAGDAATLKLVVNGLLAVQLAAAGELLRILRAAGTDLPDAADLLGSMPVTSPALSRSLPRILAGDTSPNFPLDLVAKDLGYLLSLAGPSEAPVLGAVLEQVRGLDPAADVVALAAG